eukprot:SAG31_NODE_8838_length_1377_cov_1.471049_1_plen_104_part_10
MTGRTPLPRAQSHGGAGGVRPEQQLSANAQELSQLKLSALRQQAQAASVPQEQIEEATDQDDPKGALIQLIVASTTGAAGATDAAKISASATAERTQQRPSSGA